MYSNIEIIVNTSLCIGCGACCAICQNNAISMKYNISGYLIPEVDTAKCTNCKMCCKVCPSIPENNKNNDKEKNIFHGDYLVGYIGYAEDKRIRKNSQSGGVVTGLLCYLLEKGEIDGAIVNDFNKSINRPEVKYETTKEGLIHAAGSYYSQSSVVKSIIENNNKKSAAVVLGCQAESIKAATDNYKNINRPEYLIGLFCAGQYSGNYIDALLNYAHTKDSDVEKFRFRDKDAGGWPGNVKIYTKKGNIEVDRKVRHALKSIYEVPRCFFCFEMMCTNCDLSVGDPWGISGKLDKEGYTVVIARTRKGKKILENAKNDGFLHLEKLDVNSIMKGQAVDTRLKNQFVTMMNYAADNLSYLPYDKSIISGIDSVEKDKKKSEIIKRFEFSKKMFMVKNKSSYNLFIQQKIKKKIYVMKYNYLKKVFKKIIIKLIKTVGLK